MLKHPGELVTREQLRSQIWPEDTFVDFDHALNTAITKIRVALGDDAEHPTYIETLPRRGYRFIAEVEKPRSEATDAEVVAAPDWDRKIKARWRWAVFGVAAVCLLLTLVVWRLARNPLQSSSIEVVPLVALHGSRLSCVLA